MLQLIQTHIYFLARASYESWTLSVLLTSQASEMTQQTKALVATRDHFGVIPGTMWSKEAVVVL